MSASDGRVCLRCPTIHRAPRGLCHRPPPPARQDRGRPPEPEPPPGSSRARHAALPPPRSLLPRCRHGARYHQSPAAACLQRRPQAPPPPVVVRPPSVARARRRPSDSARRTGSDQPHHAGVFSVELRELQPLLRRDPGWSGPDPPGDEPNAALTRIPSSRTAPSR
nr:proline-rich protein HaeIII subfamily 1-like [Aegilops tauschii subsp. strangulata]